VKSFHGSGGDYGKIEGGDEPPGSEGVLAGDSDARVPRMNDETAITLMRRLDGPCYGWSGPATVGSIPL